MSTILFSADSTNVSRSARLRIYCDELVDTINVVQQSDSTDAVYCIADFINGETGNADSRAIMEPVDIAVAATLPDNANKYFMFTGTIASVVDEQTGALYIADAGGHSLRVESIGMGRRATGDARIGLLEAYGLGAGDTITIIGCKSSENGNPLIINAFYFSHSK